MCVFMCMSLCMCVYVKGYYEINTPDSPDFTCSNGTSSIGSSAPRSPRATIAYKKKNQQQQSDHK